MIVLHPFDSKSELKAQIDAKIQIHENSNLQQVTFRIKGEFDQLIPTINEKIKQPISGVQTDGLWKQTCFEWFVGIKNNSAYFEFNVAPDGRWAAYAFSAYREKLEMNSSILRFPPSLHFESDEDCLIARISCQLPAELVKKELHWRPAMILFNRKGHTDFYTHHHRQKPDFHLMQDAISIS